MNALRINEEVVSIGSTVVVRDLETNEVDVYTLVPPNHADISLNRISSLTPVAHALYGRRVGETVDDGRQPRFRCESGFGFARRSRVSDDEDRFFLGRLHRRHGMHRALFQLDEKNPRRVPCPTSDAVRR